jgi:hypothetical protein
MADVAMSFRIEELHGRGRLWLRATDGRDVFVVRIDPGAEKLAVGKNPEKDPHAWDVTRDLPGSLRGQTIEVSLFDRQFLLSIAGRTLVEEGIDVPERPPVADRGTRYSGSLAIGAEGLGVVLDRLRVYRDVYYTEPVFATSGHPPTGVFVGPRGK